MKGSIRMAVGFLAVFGAVGGIETGGDLAALVAVAACGLILAYSGVRAMKKERV